MLHGNSSQETTTLTDDITCSGDETRKESDSSLKGELRFTLHRTTLFILFFLWGNICPIWMFAQTTAKCSYS